MVECSGVGLTKFGQIDLDRIGPSRLRPKFGQIGLSLRQPKFCRIWFSRFDKNLTECKYFKLTIIFLKFNLKILYIKINIVKMKFYFQKRNSIILSKQEIEMYDIVITLSKQII